MPRGAMFKAQMQTTLKKITRLIWNRKQDYQKTRQTGTKERCKFGHEGAQQILHILGTKARRRLFFEPASKQSKYGAKPPTFTDRDERSIIDYNHRMLGGLFGKKNVEFLGATTASRSESVRYL